MIITSPEMQAEVLVVNSKSSNKAQPQTSIDIPNVLASHYTSVDGDVPSIPTKPISLKPTIDDAAVVLNVNCHCAKTVESDSVHRNDNSGGLYCLHTVHCYELPMKFSFLPNTLAGRVTDGVGHRKYLADRKRWWPPPVFIIFISLLEISVFAYDYITVMPYSQLSTTTIPSESLLIYRPDRRLEIWRFLTYMALHANCFHLAFNVIVQLLYGLPLEMVHGSARIAAIYFAGVLAGSLGTSVIDSEVYLVGASGGVYALLAAQLANVMINFGQLRYGVSQLMAVLIFVFCDTGYAFYSRYIIDNDDAMLIIIPSVSYIAHLTGSLAGFTIGLLVLTNFEHNCQSNVIRWLALAVYGSFTLFAIAFNLVNTVAAQKLEEKGEVIKQHLLHDLGIS